MEKPMKIEFKQGFEYKGFNFGWSDDSLYRLPIIKYGRQYTLRKLSLIEVGSNKGYRVVRDKKTALQLKKLTSAIDYTYDLLSDVIMPTGKEETVIPDLVGLCPSCGEEISRNGEFNDHNCKKV